MTREAGSAPSHGVQEQKAQFGARSGRPARRPLLAVVVGALLEGEKADGWFFLSLFEGNLIGHQGGGIGRLGHREVGRQVAVEQPRALEFRQPGQILDGVEPEVIQELLRSCRR